MTIRLQESDLVTPGCVQSHEFLEKTHPLLCPRHVQQSLERQKVCVTVQSHWTIATHILWRLSDKWGQDCSWIRIDYLIRDDYACSPLLHDFVIDLTMNLVSTVLLEIQDNRIFFNCFTHAMVNARCRDSPRMCASD